MRNLCIAFLICCSCTSSHIWFEKPQPAAGDEVQKFAEENAGTYLSINNLMFNDMYDSARLELSPSQIVVKHKLFVKQSHEKFMVFVSDSSNHVALRGMRLFETDKKDTTGYQIFYKGDSVVIDLRDASPDTLFGLTPKYKALKYRGKIYLNTQEREDYWTVKQLDFERGSGLWLNSMCDSIDLLLLYKISGIQQFSSADSARLELKADNRYYLFDPTMREFRKFLRKGGFSVRQYFRKQ
jgi:hypothetical protein